MIRPQSAISGSNVEHMPRHYLTQQPEVVPAGLVLVHNHVRTQPLPGLDGFRAWLQEPDADELEACPCRWASWLGEHYRLARVRREATGMDKYPRPGR